MRAWVSNLHLRSNKDEQLGVTWKEATRHTVLLFLQTAEYLLSHLSAGEWEFTDAANHKAKSICGYTSGDALNHGMDMFKFCWTGVL